MGWVCPSLCPAVRAMESDLGARAGSIAAVMMFFDNKNRYRGSASQVTSRAPAFSGLTVMDVVGADRELAPFLTCLDRSVLSIQHPTTGATLFTFQWASGYENGSGIRVQGMLVRSS